MRKLVYYIACSVDGFIARADGRIDDFAFDGEHVADLLHEYPETIPTHLRADLGVDAANKHFGAVLMGRRTYEVGLSVGVTSPYQHLDQYVFSTTQPDSPNSDVTLISTGAVEAVRDLKAQSGLDVWLCGGGVLASALFNEIDELVVKSNPFLMGSGMTLFAEEIPKTDLQLVDRRVYANGFALMQYNVTGER